MQNVRSSVNWMISSAVTAIAGAGSQGRGHGIEPGSGASKDVRRTADRGRYLAGDRARPHPHPPASATAVPADVAATSLEFETIASERLRAADPQHKVRAARVGKEHHDAVDLNPNGGAGRADAHGIMISRELA